MLRNIVYRIKYQFSEPYRIRKGRGLSPIRNERELKALLDFCREELKDRKHMSLNPERRKIYKATINLSDENCKLPYEFQLGKDAPKKRYISIYDFIEDHVGWYWS